MSSKLIANQWGLHLYIGTGGGAQILKFCPKITPNIGIMHITSQSGPFDYTK